MSVRRAFALSFAGAFGVTLGRWCGRLAGAAVVSFALGLSRGSRLSRARRTA